MARTGCGVQPCVLVLHGFAPAMDMTSHLVVNLLEICPVFHHPSSLLHKQMKCLLLTALAGGWMSLHPTNPPICVRCHWDFPSAHCSHVVGANSSWEHPQLDASVSADMGVMAPCPICHGYKML